MRDLNVECGLDSGFGFSDGASLREGDFGIVSPFLNLDIWPEMLEDFSNFMPMSKEVQLQYPQANIHCPERIFFVSAWSELTLIGAVQIGQLKQFLVHLSELISLKLTKLEQSLRRFLVLTYLPPSPWTILLGNSKMQLGQYQQAISSIVHLGHLNW